MMARSRAPSSGGRTCAQTTPKHKRTSVGRNASRQAHCINTAVNRYCRSRKPKSLYLTCFKAEPHNLECLILLLARSCGDGMLIGLSMMLCSRLCLNRRRIAILIFLLGLRGFSQVSQSSPEDAVAAGVQALTAGDLETAQKFLNQAFQQGIKYSIVFHNLGVIAPERRHHAQALSWF